VKITVFWDVMPYNLVDNLFTSLPGVTFQKTRIFVVTCANEKPAFLFLLYLISEA